MGGWNNGKIPAEQPKQPEGPGRISIRTTDRGNNREEAQHEQQPTHSGAAQPSGKTDPGAEYPEKSQPAASSDPKPTVTVTAAVDPADLPPEEKLNALYRMTTSLAQQMEKSRISEYTELLHSPFRLIWLNILSGTARGLGIALGFTFFAATIIYVLQVLGALNLPIIGDYIADIVRIVQHQLELKTF